MSLRALLRDICTGVEIYYTGRSEDEYLKTAFVLCDDYTELTSKLWLSGNVPNWSDSLDREQRRHQVALQAVVERVRNEGTFQQDVVDWLEQEIPRDRFKNYHRVQEDVRAALQNDAARLAGVEPLLRRMSARRDQRNGFFHSAHLLSLTIGKSECVDAFCDLLDYGRLLFGDKWDDELKGARNLQTMEILLRLEKKTGNNPALRERINRVFQSWARNEAAPARGSMVARYPNDLHVRLCVIHGDSELRNQLQTLLDSLN